MLLSNKEKELLEKKVKELVARIPTSSINESVKLQQMIQRNKSRLDLHDAVCKFPNLRIAKRRLIDSVWTLAFLDLGNKQAHVLLYGREFIPSYHVEVSLASIKCIESDTSSSSRTLVAFEYQGEYFEVLNLKNIFSYNSSIEEVSQLIEVAESVLEKK